MAQDLRGQRQPGPRLDEPCPRGAPQGMERLAVAGHVIDACPGQAAAHEGRAGRVPHLRVRRLEPDEHFRGVAIGPTVQDPLNDGVACQGRRRH